MSVEEHTVELAGSPFFFRRAPSPEEVTPVLLHDVPTSSDDLVPLLAHSGGLAPDLLGYGRSGKGGHLELTLHGLAAGVAALLDHLEVGRVRLLGHGWGAAVALELAATDPSRIERLTLVSPAPLVAGHRYGRLERALRTPGLGELVMGATTRAVLGRYLAAACVRRDAFDTEAVRALHAQFDQGTQRAVLRLVRSTAPDHLAGYSADVPTRVVRGARDPRLTEAEAHGLGDAVDTVSDAGHWPWLDRPETAPDIAA